MMSSGAMVGACVWVRMGVWSSEYDDREPIISGADMLVGKDEGPKPPYVADMDGDINSVDTEDTIEMFETWRDCVENWGAAKDVDRSRGMEVINVPDEVVLLPNGEAGMEGGFEPETMVAYLDRFAVRMGLDPRPESVRFEPVRAAWGDWTGVA